MDIKNICVQFTFCSKYSQNIGNKSTYLLAKTISETLKTPEWQNWQKLHQKHTHTKLSTIQSKQS